MWKAYLDHAYAQNLAKTTFVANLKIDVIYAFYPESFCDKNLAIRKVFAFCDSVCQAPFEVHFRVAKSFLISKVAPFALSHWRMVQHIWWSFVLHFVLSLFSYQKKGVPCLQRADNQTTRRCPNPAELFTTSVFVFRRRISIVCRRLSLKNIASKLFSTRSIFLAWDTVYCWQEYFMQSINWKWFCGSFKLWRLLPLRRSAAISPSVF